MTPYMPLVFSFFAWMFRSLHARSLPSPWPPRPSGSASAAEARLRGLENAGIFSEVLRVVRARPTRPVGMALFFALRLSLLSLAHAALLSRVADAWWSGRWGAFLCLLLLEAACLSVIAVYFASSAFGFAVSVASFYCCADDDGGRARAALAERLIEEARCRRIMAAAFRALVVVALYTAAVGAAVLPIRWLVALALGGHQLNLGVIRDIYLAWLLYMGAESQLALVVSVLEPDEHANRCFSRSSALLIGNFCAAAGAFSVLAHTFELLHMLFRVLVLDNSMLLGGAIRVAAALAMVAAVWAVVVVALVAQPVVYFMCKAYHREPIDLALGEHEPVDAGEH